MTGARHTGVAATEVSAEAGQRTPTRPGGRSRREAGGTSSARLKTAAVPPALRTGRKAAVLTAAVTAAVTPNASLAAVAPAARDHLHPSAFNLTLAVMRQVQIATFKGTTGTRREARLWSSDYDVVSQFHRAGHGVLRAPGPICRVDPR